MATIHFVLQGKGGVGKSMVSAILYQTIQSLGHEVKAYDSDPINATLAGFREFTVERLELLNPDGNISARKFDELLDALAEAPEQQHIVVDNGASSFIAFGSYMQENAMLETLEEHGHTVYFHTIITGGLDKTGNAMVVGRADIVGETPQRLIQAEIANCIEQWRTVTADVELQKKMLERLAYFFGGHAKGVLRNWYEENNPFEIAQSGKLIHVEIKALPLPVSKDSYRVEWVETTRSHEGVELNKQTYEATVTVQVTPPVNDTVLLHNPGGIYLTQLAVSKVLNVPQDTKQGSQQ